MLSRTYKVGLLAVSALACVLGLSACETVSDTLGCTPERDAAGNLTGRIICPKVTATRVNTQHAAMGGAINWAAAQLPDGWSAQVAPVNASTFDAAIFRLSLDGSNVPLGADSGSMTIVMYQGDTAIGSNVFQWVRNGTDLIAQQPSAVTAWVRQYPQADGFEAKTSLTFNSTPAPMAVVQTATIYNGATYASSSQSFAMPRPGVGTRPVTK